MGQNYTVEKKVLKIYVREPLHQHQVPLVAFCKYCAYFVCLKFS